MTGSCRRCLGGERQRQAVIWAARIASLLMTPTVPFLPKARITIKSESHLLTWSPRYPAQGLFTHMHRRGHPRSGSRGWKGGRLRAGHGTNRETEGMCSCSVAEWNRKILQEVLKKKKKALSNSRSSVCTTAGLLNAVVFTLHLRVIDKICFYRLN